MSALTETYYSRQTRILPVLTDKNGKYFIAILIPHGAVMAAAGIPAPLTGLSPLGTSLGMTTPFVNQTIACPLGGQSV